MLRAIFERLIIRRAAKKETNDNTDSSIGSDAPIRTIDQDRLRRADFAERIANILSTLSLEEGRVFAIRGGWGFGKSSLKYLIIEKLKSRVGGADWLDFSPWQWGDGDAIARALFEEIANSLGGTYSEGAAKRASKLRLYGHILTGAAEPLKKAAGDAQLLTSILTSVAVVTLAGAVGFSLPTVAEIAAVIAILAVVAPLLGKALAYLGRDRRTEPLDRIRQSLAASLRELKKPLVIFVDDIDRLEPDQIRHVLRQVKANANLPNLVFVLIFQPSIVQAALKPVAEGDEAAFLEKIVQANFDLPAVPLATVHRIFTEQLSELASVYAREANGFQQVRWGNCLVGCIQPFIRNLRDSRRLLSSIAIHLPLHAQSLAFEVNIIDFLVLETIRVFEPELHDLLFRDRDLVLQTKRFEGDGRNASEKARIELILNVVNEERRDVAKYALKQIFPRIESIIGNVHYGYEWYGRWIAEKRVCTDRYFPRYFELQTPVGELSESEFVFLLNCSSDSGRLLRALSDFEARDLLASIAQRIDESVDRLPIENASILLPAMFTLAQKLVETRSADPFNSPWVSAWRAVSSFLKRLPAEDRKGLAVDALRSSEALSVGAIIIHLSDATARNAEERQNFAPTLDESGVLAMKEEWLRQITLLAEDTERMLSQPDLASQLYRWREYSGSTSAAKQWVTTAIENDRNFARFVFCLMSRGTTTSWGDKVSVPHYTFNRDSIEDFIGIRIADERSEALDLRTLSPEEAHAIRTLRQHLSDWEAGKTED